MLFMLIFVNTIKENDMKNSTKKSAHIMRDIYSNHLERRTNCSAPYVIAHQSDFKPIDRWLAFKCMAANLIATGCIK